MQLGFALCRCRALNLACDYCSCNHEAQDACTSDIKVQRARCAFPYDCPTPGKPAEPYFRSVALLSWQTVLYGIIALLPADAWGIFKACTAEPITLRGYAATVVAPLGPSISKSLVFAQVCKSVCV